MARWVTPKYKEILMDSLQEYVKADFRKRREIIKELKGKIRNIARDANGSLPEGLSQVKFYYTISSHCLTII
jgi:hypothetical protein